MLEFSGTRIAKASYARLGKCRSTKDSPYHGNIATNHDTATSQRSDALATQQGGTQSAMILLVGVTMDITAVCCQYAIVGTQASPAVQRCTILMLNGGESSNNKDDDRARIATRHVLTLHPRYYLHTSAHVIHVRPPRSFNACKIFDRHEFGQRFLRV